jgi:hypothetical protein
MFDERKLGLTCFGGPIAYIGYFRARRVRRARSLLSSLRSALSAESHSRRSARSQENCRLSSRLRSASSAQRGLF